MAVNQVVAEAQQVETDKQDKDLSKKPARGDAAKKSLKASVAAAQKATEEINKGADDVSHETKEVKPAEKKPEDGKSADGSDENADFRKAHYEARMKQLKDELKAAQENTTKQNKEADDSAKKPSESSKAAKFEFPNLEMPDFKSVKEDEDLLPHVEKAFANVADWAKKTIQALVDKIEEMGGSVGEIREYAEGMSQARSQKFSRLLTQAINGAKEKIDAEYDIDELPEALGASFVKMFKAGLIEVDPNIDDPTVEDVINAWELDNRELLKLHKKAPTNGEMKKEEKKKPVIGGASAGAGAGGSGLKGKDRVKATILQYHPDQFKS